MGFLTSSAMRSYATRMKHQAQRTLRDVTLAVSRNKRELQSLQRRIKNQQSQQDFILSQQYGNALQALKTQQYDKDENGNLTDHGKQAYSDAQTSIFQAQQAYQSQKTFNDNYWNSILEAQLDPLQNKEERLEIEKQNAEEDLQFWTQTEQSYGQAAKEGIKSVVPQPSGG